MDLDRPVTVCNTLLALCPSVSFPEVQDVRLNGGEEIPLARVLERPNLLEVKPADQTKEIPPLFAHGRQQGVSLLQVELVS